MTCAYLAFTSKGLALARKLAAAQPGAVARCGENGVILANWTAAQFAQSDALVFVGAVGIAVRAIAPHCRSKATDPAVVVLDECGRFAIPLLSGHLGGANDLARRLAKACGAVPVITTATDVNGVFAVDEWAKHQHCLVAEPARIKKVSSALLAGRTVRFASDWPIQGTPPAGVEPAGDASTGKFCPDDNPDDDAQRPAHYPAYCCIGHRLQAGYTCRQAGGRICCLLRRNETGPAKHCRRGQH